MKGLDQYLVQAGGIRPTGLAGPVPGEELVGPGILVDEAAVAFISVERCAAEPLTRIPSEKG